MSADKIRLRKCHEIAGALEVGGEDTVIVIVDMMKNIRYILPTLMQVLSEHGIDVMSFTKADSCLHTRDKKVWFIPNNTPEKLAGIKANVVFFYRYHTENTITPLSHEDFIRS